ncbi:glycosyltransferase [Winogradskyella sp.]|uniref:glycosyltransferase n=1 Tax=Winogradskyella sp. TaxID=1883156 RepID=UPI003AB4A84E
MISANKKIKIAIITNIITTYREGFYDRLFKRDDIEVTVYCQDKMPGMNFISIHKKYPKNVKIIKYLSAKKEKLVWQFVPMREIIKKFDVVFVAGNPRVLSDVAFGTYLRIMQKKVVLWTMAHSYRSNKFTEGLRLFWSRIFSLIFVYTDKEVSFLKDKGFKNQYILGMNNGLDQMKIDQIIQLWPEDKLNEWRIYKGLENRLIVVSSARLDPKNNFELVLKALPKIAGKYPNILWCLIGGGEEEQKLRKMTSELNIEKHVLFVGALYDEEKLAPFFLSAKIFLHPAAIGLGVLHAFGYGLPLVVHGKSQLHGPEYAAFTDGVAGRNFIENNAESLATVVIELLGSPETQHKMKLNVQKIAREEYNVDIMVDRFVKMAKYAVTKSK